MTSTPNTSPLTYYGYVNAVAGDEASGKPPHPGFRLKAASCVTPDDADL